MTAATHVGGVGGHQFTNIAAAATTVVRAKEARLVRLLINTRIASGVITIYDSSAAASGTKVLTITNAATLLTDMPGEVEIDVHCVNGIVVVTDHNDNITVVWD